MLYYVCVMHKVCKSHEAHKVTETPDVSGQCHSIQGQTRLMKFP